MGIKTKLHASYWQMINTKSQKLPLTSGKIPPNGKWQIHTKSFGFIMVRTLFYRTLFLPFSQWKGGKERTELQSVMGIQRQGHLLHNYLFLVLTILGQKNRPPLPLCCLFSSIFSGYSMLSFSWLQIPKGPAWSFFPPTLIWCPGLTPKFLAPFSSSRERSTFPAHSLLFLG